ncbi:MAG: T9SS type A sorting domain-containing protein [Bacteroidota bacterium]
MKHFFYSIIFFFCITLTFGQAFYKNKTNRALTFNELKIQFNDFKKNNDLSKQKNWKNYKRWEYEMELHTDTKGEPAGFDEYINATIDMANFKQQQTQNSASAVWAPFGPNATPVNQTGYMENGIGRINCIAFHPTNSNTFFVGVAQGGVWKTTNNGATWTPLTDNLPITRISDIVINPANPNEMYISLCDFEYVGVSLHLNGRKRHTHYGLGVYKTLDGGLTWAPTGLTYNLTNGDASLIRKILINPTNTNEIVACGVTGMYKSLNGGSTWTKKLDSLFWDMHQDPVNPNIIYAATGWVMTSNIGNAGVYKSTDFGNTWTMLNTGMPLTGDIQRVKLAIAPSNPNIIYAMCVDIFGGLYGIYESSDAGVNWNLIIPNESVLDSGQGFTGGGQGNYDLGLLVDFSDPYTLYVGGVNMWTSYDGAYSFVPMSHWTTQYGATLHGDIHDISRNPLTGNYFVCSDGGVYQTPAMIGDSWSTTAWPTVWTQMNTMQISSFYRLSSSKNVAGQLIAGAQDNASMYYNAGSWSTIFGGDGMDNCLFPTSSTDVFGSSQYGNFYMSTNNGLGGSNPTTNPNLEQAEWVTPVVVDYNNPGVMYIGNENVVQSTDFGNTWAPLASIYSNTLTGQNSEVSALAVSNSNSQVIYAARRVRYELGINGIVFKTTNGGASFVNVTNNLPDSLYYTGIEINASNASIVYVSMAGFTAADKVYTTINGGATWQNITYNLPNLPVNCIKQIPGSNDLMVATDIGVYTLAAGSTTWVNNSFGLPNVIVSDIEFNPALNKVYVSTFGRGIWETTINSIVTGVKSGVENIYNYALFPTVNTGSFSLVFENDLHEKNIEVIDVMGKVVYTQKTNLKKLELSLNLSSGTYFVRTTSNHLLGVKKMIVE